MRRRDLLLIGGAAAVGLTIPSILRRSTRAFDFEPLKGFDGFRRLDRGPVSGGIDIFAGLDAPPEPPSLPAGSLCQALFGTPDLQGGRLPIAVFSDVNCPNCAAFEYRLYNIIDTGASVHVVYHQLPLLGERSVWAARVILAAGLQGRYEAVHRDLMNRSLRPGSAGTRNVAERHGLNAAQLFADAQGPEVAARLDRSLALGSALGIPGTPGSVVGRTLVIGALAQTELEQLIALERSEPFDYCA